MNQTKTLWTRTKENLAAMAHAARVGLAVEHRDITVDQARILMTGSVESGEPRVVRVDLAPTTAADLRLTR